MIPRVLKSAVKAGVRACGYQLVPIVPPAENLGVPRENVGSGVSAGVEPAGAASVASCAPLSAAENAGDRTEAESPIVAVEASTAKPGPTPSYNADSLIVYGKNVEFIHNPKFMAAYRRGMNSGHCIGRPPGSDLDIHIEWRVAVCCWAARHAAKLRGDFVECGVNTGIFSLAVCEYVDFNSLDKSFYLFDTFEGIPLDQMSDREKSMRNIPLVPLDGESVVSGKYNEMFPQCYEIAARNFALFPGARLIRGTVPESFSTVNIESVAYLSIDMNIAYPERAAIENFWPKLSSGAIVVLDDYAWQGHGEQKALLDEFTRDVGVEILTLPTGQGLIIKP